MAKLKWMLLAVLFLPYLLLAQVDTVYVPANNLDGSPLINSLVEYVAADTNELGEQLHQVYKLERGQLYVLEQPLDLHNPVELVADPPRVDGPLYKPPKILANAAENGEAATPNLLRTWADLSIKNIWLGGICTNGEARGWGMGQALAVMDSFVTIQMDGVWADYNGWSVFACNQPYSRWYINNLHARNEQNPGDVWTTFLFYLDGSTVVDTFKITNSTYFQSNSFFLFPPQKLNYFEMDHCTLVNTLKWPVHSRELTHAVFTNNIFYNVSSLSMTANEEEGSDPDPHAWGIINADTLTFNLYQELDSLAIHEKERIYIVKNNIYYWTPGIVDYWEENDSVKSVCWMDEQTQAMFDADTSYPNFIAENNWNIDPAFDDFDMSECDNLLVQVCKDFRSGTMHTWDWDTDMQEHPEQYKLEYTWPLPEYFKSYAGKLGTDGLPVGDMSYLEHFPLQISNNGPARPFSFSLQPNYPNPFNNTTTITFTLEKNSHIRLSVYDVTGKRVTDFINAGYTAGRHAVLWDGRNSNGSIVASGIYWYKLQTDRGELSRKMLLLK